MDSFSDPNRYIRDSESKVEHRVRATADTIFVLGNGPSLKEIDLQELSGFACVGLNAAYRYWKAIDWRPTHYSCLDLVVGLSHIDEIDKLIREDRIQHFLLRDNLIQSLGAVANTKRVTSYEDLAGRDLLFADPTITTGSGAAIWGAYLGFRDIVIAGVDGNYKEVVDGAVARDGIELEIVREGANANYFFDGYQRPGDRYNLPNPTPGLHANAWLIAAQKIYSFTDARIFNANPNSEIRHFPIVKMSELLKTGSLVSPPPKPMTQPVDFVANQANDKDAPSLRQRVFSAEWKRMAVILIGFMAGMVWIGGANFDVFQDAVPMLMGTTLLFGLTIAFVYSRRALSLHLSDLDEQIRDMKAATRHPKRNYDKRRPVNNTLVEPHKFLRPLLHNRDEGVKVDFRTFFAGDGWHRAEPHGRWAGNGDVASIYLSDLPAGSYSFEIEVVQSALHHFEEDIELRFGSEVIPFNVLPASKGSGLGALRNRLENMLLGTRQITFPALIQGKFTVSGANRAQPESSVLAIACKDINRKPQKVAGESRVLTICVSQLTLKSIQE